MTSTPTALSRSNASVASVASVDSLARSRPATAGRLKITACGLTDVGRRRDHNEDVFGIDHEHGLYLVCDGMGGHAAGEVAAALARDVVGEELAEARAALHAGAPLNPRSLTLWHQMALDAALRRAHAVVREAARESRHLAGMGTTIVALQATPDALIVGHVGDSRAYRWRPFAGLERVTRDHSLVSRLLEAGIVGSELEAKALHVGNIILRAVGGECGEPELTVVPRCPGDVLLLCSDGLTDMLDDEAIEGILWACADDLPAAARRLVAEANAAGGHDNVTVVLARLDDDFHAGAHVDPAALLAPLGDIALDRRADGVDPDETAPDPRALWLPPDPHRACEAA
jgi:protein phosphatase